MNYLLVVQVFVRTPGGSEFKRRQQLKKNTLQLKTLFALSNLWMVRHQLLAAQHLYQHDAQQFLAGYAGSPA